MFCENCITKQKSHWSSAENYWLTLNNLAPDLLTDLHRTRKKLLWQMLYVCKLVQWQTTKNSSQLVMRGIWRTNKMTQKKCMVFIWDTGKLNSIDILRQIWAKVKVQCESFQMHCTDIQEIFTLTYCKSNHTWTNSQPRNFISKDEVSQQK